MSCCGVMPYGYGNFCGYGYGCGIPCGGYCYGYGYNMPWAGCGWVAGCGYPCGPWGLYNPYYVSCFNSCCC